MKYAFISANEPITINGEEAGTMKTNLSGKLNLSVELGEGIQAEVSIIRL